MTKFFSMPRPLKRLLTAFCDINFVVIAIYLAFIIRVDKIEYWISNELYWAVTVTAIVTALVAIKLGLYRAVIRFIDTKALTTVVVCSFVSGSVLLIASYLFSASLPRSIPFIYTLLLLIFIGGSRLLIRGLINSQTGSGRKPVLIYGAGSAGRQLAYSIDNGNEYRAVAFIDDNKELYKCTVANLRIYNDQWIEKLVREHGIEKVLLAMPSASVKKRKQVILSLEKLGIQVLTIPGSADLIGGRVQLAQLREIGISDLLGRDAVAPIPHLFSRCIQSKNVLVTGAGGSIGSELCRQVLAQNPRVVVLYEASEFALYSIEKELQGVIAFQESNTQVVPILGNVLDDGTFRRTLSRFAIHTVYHAAAYKHVPLVEYNMSRGILNNVWGTLCCAKAAIDKEVEHFVLVSTDKAVRPTNVMGATKRLAELILQAYAKEEHATQFNMVRFGNVLGSSGSVVPLFKKQIESGGPVTVTHADITRYFMTIPEAAQLVIQAGSMGEGGEVYVLDMGEPVKIKELAENMIRLSGLTVKESANPEGDIEIAYSGLRPGEKLYEELLIGDDVVGTEHPRIMKAKERSMSLSDLMEILEQLEQLVQQEDVVKIRQLLLDAPLDYNPSSEISDLLGGEKAPLPGLKLVSKSN